MIDRLPGAGAVVAIAVVLVSVAGLAIATRTPQAVPLTPVEAVSAVPVDERSDSITVHVAGGVRRPGLVSLSPDARVADAVAAAGGASGSAELAAINLAAPVHDGMQIVVPQGGDSGHAGGPVVDGGSPFVDINTAGVAELTGLPGVGAVLAARIVDHRDTNGPFGSVDDLLDVPGIGEGKLSAIREMARVR